MMTTVLSHVEGAGSLAASHRVQSLSSSSLRRPALRGRPQILHSGKVPFALPDDTLLDLFCHRVVQKYQETWRRLQPAVACRASAQLQCATSGQDVLDWMRWGSKAGALLYNFMGV